MRLDNDNPKPQPLGFVVKPGLKIVLYLDFGIPLPVSVISINTLYLIFFKVIIMFPLSEIASIEFLHRFSITHSNNDWLSGIKIFCRKINQKINFIGSTTF